MRAASIATATAAGCLGLIGCGSATSLPPAAEPPVSPPPGHDPAGKVVKVGVQPEGITVDPSTGLAAIGLRNPDRLILIDAADGRQQRKVALAESPRHLSLLRPGGPVLVPAERANRLLEVSLPAGRVRSLPVGTFPHDAAGAGSLVFVANEMGDSLSRIDGGRVRTVDAPKQPGGIATTADGRPVLVAVRERVLRDFDPITLKPLHTVSGGVGPTHIVSDGSQRVYVADTDGHAILAYRTDAGRLEFVDRINLPAAPYGIAIDQKRHRMWVTEPARNRIVEFSIPRYQGAVRRLDSYPTVRQPNTVAVDPRTGRVLITGRYDGVVQILSPAASN